MKKFNQMREKVLKISHIQLLHTRNGYPYKIVEFEEIILPPENNRWDIASGIKGKICFWARTERNMRNLRTNQIETVNWGSSNYNLIEIGQIKKGKIESIKTTTYKINDEEFKSFNCVAFDDSDMKNIFKITAKEMSYQGISAHPIDNDGNKVIHERQYRDTNELGSDEEDEY